MIAAKRSENASIRVVAPDLEPNLAGTSAKLFRISDYTATGHSADRIANRTREIYEEREMLVTFRRMSSSRRREIKKIAIAMLEEDAFGALVREAPLQASAALSTVWDNPEDARYNEL